MLDKVSGLDRFDALIGHNKDDGMVMLPFMFPNLNLSEGILYSKYYSTLLDYTLAPLLTNNSGINELMDLIVAGYNYSFSGSELRTPAEQNLKYATDMLGKLK